MKNLKIVALCPECETVVLELLEGKNKAQKARHECSGMFEEEDYLCPGVIIQDEKSSLNAVVGQKKEEKDDA